LRDMATNFVWPGTGDNHCRADALFSMRLRVYAKA
jgi:hypothetical protein